MRIRAAGIVLLLLGALFVNSGQAQAAEPKDAPAQAAEPKDAPAQAAEPKDAPAQAAVPKGQTVTFDKYSMMIGGKRTVIWSGEMHPYRIPSPDLWRDVLQKMRASGYNAVSFYFDWGYHSPESGVYDFSGVR